MGDMKDQASQMGLIKGWIKRSDNPGDTSWAWNSAYGTERTLTVGCWRTCFLFPARSWKSKKRHQQLLDISRIKLNFVTSASRGTGSLTRSLWEHWSTFCFCTTSGASRQNRFVPWTSEVCLKRLYVFVKLVGLIPTDLEKLYLPSGCLIQWQTSLIICWNILWVGSSGLHHQAWTCLRLLTIAGLGCWGNFKTN